MSRVAGKGLVDRSRPLKFRFDGASIQGFEGDTVASALLGSGLKLVGRSFKYHRPRGIVTAGSEEPNALVTVGQGAGQVPNVRATMLEATEGLEVRSQNAWPSLGFDLLSINDLAAPFLGAGFYYKTFMRPRRFWESVYEPFIRKAAGLGALSGEAPEVQHEKAFAFCDVLIIGGGPAGLMAAWTAGLAGGDVILADEDLRLGGRLLNETHEVDGKPGHVWAAEMAQKLEAMPNVRVMTRTAITGAYDGGIYGGLERQTDGQRETFWRIATGNAILAAGATERHVAFRDNDRPGIMNASAVRAYLNRWGVSPGRAVTVFANNDDAHRTALDLKASGITVAAVIDARAEAEALGDYRLISGAHVTGTAGRKGLESITLLTPSGTERIATDCLAVSGGWNPNVHMTCHMNGRPDWNDDLQAFVPTPGAVPGLVAVGSCNGAFSTAACLAEGQKAALELFEKTAEHNLPEAEDDPYRISALWFVPGKGRAWLDFQNDVTVKDVQQAAQENYASVEHMKRYTTQGMATDQGKASNVPALAVLADATERGVPQTGTTTFRPPYVPVSIAAMGAGGEGAGFAPERRTTSDKESRAIGAPMIEAGLWYRASYFPREGETTWRQSCDREVLHVREAVGVCDVSTLGKIDIQGPDAGEFLDFVYTNTFSTLNVGRVRYGLMLREDGLVMDDGTTARLGENHFLMTTTTAAAGPVMRHLEFVLQVLRPDWDVRIASVTEQWAQFAVAGPKARELLGERVSNIDMPFMGCSEVDVMGVEGRIFRISFSGELGFEVAVPARFGASLFQHLLQGAEALGGGAYGVEALNVLRIEKGFITHAEIDGRATAEDIGMKISDKKACIGQRMARREGLVQEGRVQLIGLKPAEDGRKLTAGAHLFATDADLNRFSEEGFVTSVAYSPTLGHFVGLGFVKGGRARVGERLKLVDHMRGYETQVQLCDPVFFDKDGGRSRV